MLRYLCVVFIQCDLAVLEQLNRDAGVSRDISLIAVATETRFLWHETEHVIGLSNPKLMQNITSQDSKFC